MLIVFLRAIILYGIIMFSVRLMGKRQLGELQPSELVITILISNIASLPIEDTSIPMILGIIPVLSLVSFDIIISNISLKSKSFRRFISGSPLVIIHDGIVDQKQLRKLRFSIDDLMESIRQAGIFNLQDVEFAIVETTGKVSVLQKNHAEPITPTTLNLTVENKPPPTLVISDGKIIKHGLIACGTNENWILKKIKKEHCILKQVFIMTCDSDLNYHIIKKTM